MEKYQWVTFYTIIENRSYTAIWQHIGNKKSDSPYPMEDTDNQNNRRHIAQTKLFKSGFQGANCSINRRLSMRTDTVLEKRIEREQNGTEYCCPAIDKPLLQKMMNETNVELGTDIRYIAQIDYYDIKGAGVIYAKYIDDYMSESVRAYLIPQIVSDGIPNCEDVVLGSYFRFKESKEYISEKGKPAPSHIYVRYDNALKHLKPIKKADTLLELASYPRDAFYLPLTMRMAASWKLPSMEDILLSYLETERISAKMIGLPEQHEGYYPSLSFVKKELLFTAIYGLRYYTNDRNANIIQEYINCSDKDVCAAANKTMSYYRKKSELGRL